MSAKLYIEGGGDSKELHARCREGFRRLLERLGFSGRMPRLVACGSRNDAFDDFSTAHLNAQADEYIALLVDSEASVADVEQTWTHLANQDGWSKPPGADDEQVLLMTTCMETWIVVDRPTLRKHFGNCLNENALPGDLDIESKSRDAILNALIQATRACKLDMPKGRRPSRS
ncbi:MAG TPA: DUF4276 family protein [Pirellulales bacterium]|nr:DUF4276 family protein [Pirellulales bacterium]